MVCVMLRVAAVLALTLIAVATPPVFEEQAWAVDPAGEGEELSAEGEEEEDDFGEAQDAEEQDDSYVHAVLSQRVDKTIPGYANELSLDTFLALYKGRYPVTWHRPYLVSMDTKDLTDRRNMRSDTEVMLASSNSFSHSKKKVTLGEYLTTGMQRLRPGMKANETWYLFGDTVGDEWKPALDKFPLPLDSGSDDPIKSFGMGGQFSGVGFHSHGAAWAEVMHGTKRWYLAPPSMRPPFNGDVHMLDWALAVGRARREELEMYQSWNQAYANLYDGPNLGNYPGLPPHLAYNTSRTPLHVVELGAGEVLYIPPGWWHATLNVAGYNAFVSVFTQEDSGWGEHPLPEYVEGSENVDFRGLSTTLAKKKATGPAAGGENGHGKLKAKGSGGGRSASS